MRSANIPKSKPKGSDKSSPQSGRVDIDTQKRIDNLSPSIKKLLGSHRKPSITLIAALENLQSQQPELIQSEELDLQQSIIRNEIILRTVLDAHAPHIITYKPSDSIDREKYTDQYLIIPSQLGKSRAGADARTLVGLNMLSITFNRLIEGGIGIEKVIYKEGGAEEKVILKLEDLRSTTPDEHRQKLFEIINLGLKKHHSTIAFIIVPSDPKSYVTDQEGKYIYLEKDAKLELRFSHRSHVINGSGCEFAIMSGEFFYNKKSDSIGVQDKSGAFHLDTTHDLSEAEKMAEEMKDREKGYKRAIIAVGLENLLGQPFEKFYSAYDPERMYKPTSSHTRSSDSVTTTVSSTKIQSLLQGSPSEISTSSSSSAPSAESKQSEPTTSASSAPSTSDSQPMSLSSTPSQTLDDDKDIDADQGAEAYREEQRQKTR